MSVTLEGRQLPKLSPEPISSREFELRSRRAAKGSLRLRNAIWRLQGYSPPTPEPIKRSTICPSCMGPIVPRTLIADIQQGTAAFYQLNVSHLTGQDRRKHIVRARQHAMYLSAELTEHSIAEIGRRFKRDHTTILHAIKQVGIRSELDAQEAFDVSLLRERLSA